MHIDSLGEWKRSHDCGSLRSEHVGQKAILMGWVNSRRDLGNLIFIDLRDREGITQIVFDPRVDEESHKRAHVLRNEWVLAVKGDVSPRLEGQENPNLPSGAIEVKAKHLRILNKTDIPPFQVDGAVDASETLRLKYRYLELRRPQVFSAFRRRHSITSCIREYLDREGFIEVETPVLQPSAGGALAQPFITHHHALDCDLYLRIALELHLKRLIVGGLDKVYEHPR